jgi:hypothetical protein
MHFLISLNLFPLMGFLILRLSRLFYLFSSFLFRRNAAPISRNGRTYWRNLTRQLDIFRQLQLSLLEWTLQINLFDLFAQVCFLVDECDESIFDLQMDLRAFFDVCGEVALGRDGEGLATIYTEFLVCDSARGDEGRLRRPDDDASAGGRIEDGVSKGRLTLQAGLGPDQPSQ